MKIELSIASDYLPEWGLQEGLRELVQNAKDAETEHLGSMTTKYESGTVYIENIGARIPHRALLTGHTTKKDRDDLIGKFGEGLKFGLLALTREGYKTKIRSGSEVWIPSIEKSPRFGVDVLFVDIQKGRADKDRVCVEIPGVAESDWESLVHRVLFLQDFSGDARIETTAGTLLTDPKFKGCLYVKGIYVEQDTDLNYGYDYKDASVDRDRKMVSAFDKKWYNARIWQQAASQRPDLFEKFFALVADDSDDIEGIVEYGASGLSDKVVEEVAARFKTQFGACAVPVENIEQSRDIEHLGKRGVVVNKSLRGIVERKTGNVHQVTKNLRQEITDTYSWHELSREEQSNLEVAVKYIRIGTEDKEFALAAIELVDFRSESIMGQFKDGKYILAKKCLADRDYVLQVLVHEVAHNHGGDGDHGHVSAIERIWSGIVKHLRGTNTM